MNRYCVTLVCNFNYLDKAGFVAAQLLAQSNRNFDVVICSDVVPENRPGFLPEGAILRQLDVGETLQNLPQNERLKDLHIGAYPRSKISAKTMNVFCIWIRMSLFLAMVWLICFKLDMQDQVLAAVRDIHQRHRQDRSVQEFAVLGYETAPYFNAGVLLVDCARWLETEAFQKIMQIAKVSPEALFCHDQSLLNIHFLPKLARAVSIMELAKFR